MARAPRPTPRQATIFINKLEAARRQLDAALRMTLANEDELAIHTVAAAAYRILRDMLHKRGRHDLEDLFRSGLLGMAKKFIEGELSKDELIKWQLYDLVSLVAKFMKIHGEDVKVEDVPLFLHESSKKAHWQAMSGVSGFLKHADRLPEGMISLQDVNNDMLIFHACAAYTMVSRVDTCEMHFYHLFWCAAEPGRSEELSTIDIEIVDFLKALSPSRRRRVCMKLIRRCKKDGDLP